jgi:hypothetical protein
MRRMRFLNDVDRWALRAVAIIALLTLLFFLASLGVAYWVDEYAVPSWNEQSVPAPRTY